MHDWPKTLRHYSDDNLSFSGSSSKTEPIEFTTNKEKWVTEKYSTKCIRSDAKNISFQYSMERVHDAGRDEFRLSGYINMTCGNMKIN